MFDLGIQELIVIFIVALLVFGPKRLPELGRTIGKGIAELKRAMHGVKEQMDAELNEIKQPISLENDIHKTEEKKEKETSDTATAYGTEKANDEKRSEG
ncbi:MAG: Sec-independent protein translocase protein TatB [Nitrospirae bacterium]|jgi:Tat protein translocase TatB subunit|nr:Sec-independent protein translocase protein TatB [Nitrospirota bacterium]MCL5063198.1 Sec-independent protein translocase protein TatB [Nitrospirota bacterium]MDA8215038.1 Sec-independent protein translocase protein TatB [Nitrospiraceae bacterium]MDA8340462.1 Sec-independent protein translocase protein TatB [Nitrospiraceae bacterium]